MKMIRLFTFTLTLAGLVLGGGKSFAQGGIAPSKQFGIAVFAGGGGVSTGQLAGQYAFSPSVQLGLGLSFGGAGSTTTQNSVNNYGFDLYGKFLFEGIVNSFIQAGVRTGTQVVQTTIGSSTTTTNSDFASTIYAGFGLDYYFNRNVGVYAMYDLIDIRLSPSQTSYGFDHARVGIEWFFNP